MEPIELPEFRLTANNSKSCSTGCAGSVIRANGAVPQTVHRKGFQVYDYVVNQDLRSALLLSIGSGRIITSRGLVILGTTDATPASSMLFSSDVLGFGFWPKHAITRSPTA
jgi:hypothetical protein